MDRKRIRITLFASLLAVCMAQAIPAYAAEPVYTEEELDGGEDGEETFTMPVIVSATDHSGKDDGGGDNGGGNNDNGNNDNGSSDNGQGGGNSGGGDNGGSSTGNSSTDTSQQTFIVTVTDRFLNRAGEEQLVSVRSIGKYRRGTYLLFSATKADGYTVTGERLQSVTVERDTQIIFTYMENQTGNTKTGTTGATGTSEAGNKDGEKTGQEKPDTVSADDAEEESLSDGGEQTDGEEQRTPVIRRMNDETDSEIAEEMEEEELPEDETEEKKGFSIPWWVWLLLVFAIIAAAVTALALTGKLSYLWLLFVSRFFRNRFMGWHGILTQQESRFIDIVYGEDGEGSPLQELIDRGGTPSEVLALAEESGDMTYLPPGTKIAVSYQDGGEYPEITRISAQEEAFYTLLGELAGKGEVIATFYNDPAEIEFALTFQC